MSEEEVKKTVSGWKKEEPGMTGTETEILKIWQNRTIRYK